MILNRIKHLQVRATSRYKNNAAIIKFGWYERCMQVNQCFLVCYRRPSTHGSVLEDDGQAAVLVSTTANTKRLMYRFNNIKLTHQK